MLYKRLLRYGFYLLLLTAVFFAARRRGAVVPVALEPLSYYQRAAALLCGTNTDQLLKSPTNISGGLPDSEKWERTSGTDFTVWYAHYGKQSESVLVGIYHGRQPEFLPPNIGLDEGNIGGIPILWCKTTTKDHRFEWNAIIPKANEDYLHIWIHGLDLSQVVVAAERLRNIKFSD